MNPKVIRLLYVCEYLLALIAIFTAWPEIGGETVLDLMPWGWKFGLGAALAAAIVAYSAAIVAEAGLWTLRSARWLTTICVLLLAIGVVTYYYVLEDETVDTDDSSAALLYLPGASVLTQFS